ncbi:UDP-N-acetylglucosamine 2-epimerase [Dehalogenimonas sp. WBC-2]|nr:UDP-N-acetylglucosamine 2-epimerase [Dehalogenimonas sp. WBC-2]
MKTISVIGARPQFIKYAPLSKELHKHFTEKLIHTGQHYDYLMNKIFFEELEIPEPDYYLGVGSGTHGAQTGDMLKKIEEILDLEKPDMVLVYGDTNSTLAGALAASKMQIKIGHIEAGLRSFDKSMPEEINRVLTDHCSDLLFCPTQTAIDNLHKEGIAQGVHLTGDVMVDASLYARIRAESSDILERLHLKSKEYLLATVHRASNTDVKENLANIVEAFCQLDETLVLPLHPRTTKQLKHFGLYEKLASKVKLTEPLGYLEFTKLLNHASKVLTDSGGVQKEAYILGVPCITLRDTTEWVETVDTGWNTLAGTNAEIIVASVIEFQPQKHLANSFPCGACDRIIKTMEETSF